jgi:hypothetical protein
MICSLFPGMTFYPNIQRCFNYLSERIQVLGSEDKPLHLMHGKQ